MSGQPLLNSFLPSIPPYPFPKRAKIEEGPTPPKRMERIDRSECMMLIFNEFTLLNSFQKWPWKEMERIQFGGPKCPCDTERIGKNSERIDRVDASSGNRPGLAQVLSGRESQDRLITYQKARAILSGKIGAPAVSCATSVTAKRQDKGTPKPQLISNKQVTYCQVTLEY